MKYRDPGRGVYRDLLLTLFVAGLAVLVGFLYWYFFVKPPS
ncbi:MAG TPA: hypothetical protein VFG50_14995 [Rhodothermales bacterium]|nr:hypothetical protein [Rhodothermales bacterium]